MATKTVTHEKFSKGFVASALEPSTTYREKCSPLIIRVTAKGVKSYGIVARCKGTGKIVRVALGRVNDVKLDEARKAALTQKLMLSNGENPQEIKRQQRATREKSKAEETALEESPLIFKAVLDAYLNTRNLKPSTVYNYRCVVQAYLPDWLPQPITAITRGMIEDRHLQITRDHGKGAANNTMRVVRALCFYADKKWGDEEEPIFKVNPTRRLSDLKLWHRLPRRQSVLKPHQISLWAQAVCSAASSDARDFLLLLLFTGARKNEAARLQWRDVDIAGATAVLRDTKNGDDLELPLSDYLVELLKRRKQTATSRYVFPNQSGSGPIGDQRHHYLAITDACGIAFTPHDLRRTFLTVGDSLDISERALKRLVGHRDQDVTGGYIISQPERLRGAMQAITDRLLQLTGPLPE